MGTAAAATVTAAVATTSTNKKYVLNFHAPNNERQVPKKNILLFIFCAALAEFASLLSPLKVFNDWEKMQFHC